MKLPDPKNSLSVILDDLTARLERIEAKLNLLCERELTAEQLEHYGYFNYPGPKPKRHRQPWE